MNLCYWISSLMKTILYKLPGCIAKKLLSISISTNCIKLLLSLYPYANIVSFLYLCQSFIKYHISLHKWYLEEKLPGPFHTVAQFYSIITLCLPYSFFVALSLLTYHILISSIYCVFLC